MFHFFDAITNDKGNALIGYYVRVTDTSGNTVSLYADSNLTPIISTSGLANAALVDKDGNADFYCNIGIYSLNIYATDGTTLVKTISDYPMADDYDTATQAEASANAAAASAAQAKSYLNSLTTLPTSGLGVTAASRGALAMLATNAPAILTEAGREGVFVFSSANLSTQVAADTQQGIYVAPTSDTTGAHGAWVRKYNGPANLKWFGALGDGTTDDHVALNGALSLLNALAGGNIGFGSATPALYCPAANYYLGANMITLSNAISIYGESGATYGGQATIFTWSSNTCGFKLTAQNCYFDGITLQGPWTGGAITEGSYHAIWAVYKFGFGRLFITGWQGDGIHIDTTADGGNCNGSYGSSLSVQNCRVGVSLNGSNVNGCCFGFIDANYNRRAGVLDDSGFGNEYSALQTAGNGVQGITGSSPTCSFNNGHIFVVARGQAAGASTNSPPTTATSNTYWIYWKDAGAATSYAPQWASGTTYRDGGAIQVDGASNATNVGFLYFESDQPPLQTDQAALIGNGVNATTYGPNTRRMWCDSNGFNFTPFINVLGNVTGQQIICQNPTQAAMYVRSQSNAYTDLFFQSFNSGSWTTDLEIQGYHANGGIYNVAVGTHAFQVNGSQIAAIGSSGLTVSAGTITAPAFTVATLPSGSVGMRSFVTDANATTYASAVAGGGTNKVPVFHDGTSWKIG